MMKCPKCGAQLNIGAMLGRVRSARKAAARAERQARRLAQG